MSKNLFTPVNQIRLTNVVAVRYKMGGKRFEIACFKNKVMDWRNRIEKDIDEVLQTHRVFTNVSKGEIAKKEDLAKAFGDDMTEEDICMLILDKGEVQVSDKERQQVQDQMFLEIATNVAQKCVNPDTNRPYPVGVIERAMRDLHFAVNTAKAVKLQALDVIKSLKKKLPITRAQMRLRLTLARDQVKAMRRRIKEYEDAVIEREEVKEKAVLDCLLDPGHFREIDEAVRSLSGVLEILDLAVADETEVKVDQIAAGSSARRQHASATSPDGSEEEQSEGEAAVDQESPKQSQSAQNSDGGEPSTGKEPAKAKKEKKKDKKKGEAAAPEDGVQDEESKPAKAARDSDDDWSTSNRKKGKKKPTKQAPQPQQQAKPQPAKPAPRPWEEQDEDEEFPEDEEGEGSGGEGASSSKQSAPKGKKGRGKKQDLTESSESEGEQEEEQTSSKKGGKKAAAAESKKPQNQKRGKGKKGQDSDQE